MLNVLARVDSSFNCIDSVGSADCIDSIYRVDSIDSVDSIFADYTLYCI